MILTRRSTRSPAERWAGWLVLSLALLLCSPAEARGKRSGRQQDFEEAKRHFDKAETAYKLGNYTAAIEEYEAAYKAMPEPAFLFNIAQAHRQQYNIDRKVAHLHKALNLYKTYLRESGKVSNRATVQSLIDELRQIIGAVEERAQQQEADAARPGTLVLRGERAAGATIMLDGKAWGEVPKSGEVTPGSHTIKVSKPGYQSWSTTVTVSGGSQVDIPVMLQRTGAGSGGGEGGASDETPVYKKWWLWTIVGVAVAGAATGVGLGVYYGGGGDSVPAMPQIDLR